MKMFRKLWWQTALITPYLKPEIKLLEDAMTNIKTNLQKQCTSKNKKTETLTVGKS